MAETWITTSEAAEISGYTSRHVQKLIRAGRVEARKFGWQWQVNRRSLLEYVGKAEKKGHKRGPKVAH